MQAVSVKEKVELYISCNKLNSNSQSAPQVKLYQQVSGAWKLLKETEVLKDNQNPVFLPIPVEFTFEVQQPLKFEVVNGSQTIGAVETTLGAIVGGRKNKLKKDLSCGTLVVKAEKADENCNQVTMHWKGSKLKNTDGWFNKSDPFLKFFRMKRSGALLQVHETEVIKNNLNPEWKPIKISDVKLGARHSRTFKVECWDHEKDGNHQFIGECLVDLDSLKAGTIKFPIASKKGSKAGKIKIKDFSIEYRKTKPTFVDHIKEGTKLNVAVAIDFTGSNGDPKGANSLHRLTGNPPNEYHQAIASICPVILNYDSDGTVPVYGFGGVPTYSKETSHCFSLTGDPNKPEVKGLEGVLDTYRKSISNVQQSGPTYFNGVLKEAIKFCQNVKDKKLDQYMTLLILTDGVIDDMKETTELLVKASTLPLSVVIVGVGSANFTSMKTLDGDTNMIAASTGQAKRDIVQFVPFSDCKNDPKKLAETVLAEVPRQLSQYMELFKPKC